MQIIDQHELISYDQADHLAEEFEVILKKHGIVIAKGSPLENGLLLLHELKELHQKPSLDLAWPALGDDLQEALGMLHMIRLVTRRANHSDFCKLVPYP